MAGESSERDANFGRRVKAARAYAGLTQAELAKAIVERFPGVSCSAPTIKRVEGNVPEVKGSRQQWAMWVAEATGYPYELLVWEYEGLGSFGQEALRWVPYSNTHWLRIGFNLLWRLKRAGVSPERQRPLLETLRREGGMPLTEDDLSSPGAAWGHIEDRLRKERIWLRHKEGELLEEHGFDRFIGLVQIPWIDVLFWVGGELDLPEERIEGVRETVKWAIMDRFAPDRSLPVQEGRELSTPRELRDAGVAWGADGLWSEIEELEYEALPPEEITHEHPLSLGDPDAHADAGSTPRSAADDPLPPPDGELAHGPRASEPSAPSHEQSQTLEEPDVREGAGG